MANPGDDDDTPTVILTPAQREFIDNRLEGELGDMSDAAIRQTRYRIRERAKVALDDLEWLRNLSHEDLARIGNHYRENWHGARLDGEDLIPFLLSDMLDTFIKIFDENTFTTAVEKAVKRHREEQLRQQQKVGDISVDTNISVDNIRTADELKERYDAEGQLTEDELFLLAFCRRIPAEVYNEQVESSTLEFTEDI